MATRIAISSSDGRMVDEHFGTTPQFLILDACGDDLRCVDLRRNQPSCHGTGHDDSSMERSIRMIEDCQVLITVRASALAQARLAERGIHVHQEATSIAAAVAALRNGQAVST